MAIQISGTQVISNSRGLTNIASVDATTTATLNAAGIGAGDLPPAPNWGSPTATVSSSGSWSKPGSIANTDWVVFYLVGGGGGVGEYKSGGGGASAVIIALKGSLIPSSVPMTIGVGGIGIRDMTNGNGTATTINISGTVLSAPGGKMIVGAGGSYPPDAGLWSLLSDGTDLTVILYGNDTSATGAPATWANDGGPSINNAIFGGAAGAASSFSYAAAPGGVSTYAGNGGNGLPSPAPGAVPGGGAGGSSNPAANPGTSGGAGNVRIYY